MKTQILTALMILFACNAVVLADVILSDGTYLTVEQVKQQEACKDAEADRLLTELEGHCLYNPFSPQSCLLTETPAEWDKKDKDLKYRISTLINEASTLGATGGGEVVQVDFGACVAPIAK